MSKIKNFFTTIIDSVQKALSTFPMTTIIVFVLTFIITFFVIDVELSFEMEDAILNILSIGGIAAVGTWLVEAVFENKKDIRRIILYVLSFVIAIIFNRLLNNKNFDDYKISMIMRWLVEYILICIFCTVYVLSQKSKINFERYVLNLVLKFNQLSITYLIVSLGFLFLYGIFVVLILDTLEYTIFLKMLCIFTGFYYVPVCLKAFEGKNVENTKFNRFVFLKILLPLLLVSMLIVYIYIGKLFILSSLPNNHVFFILSTIFVFAFPIYLINKNYSDSFGYKLNKFIPYLYIPFILLQIYAIGLRISEYSITHSRYMAIVLIIFEIMSIFLFIYKDSKYLSKIIIFSIFISAFCLISPFNIEEIPMLSQKAVVDKYVRSEVKFESLAEADKKKIAGAYQYIEHNEKYVNPNLSQIEKDKLSSYKTYRTYYDFETTTTNNNEYLNYSKDIDDFNISKYNKIYKLPRLYDVRKNIVRFNNKKIDIQIDLTDYIDKIINANKISESTAERTFDEIEIIKIDENRDFYITYFSCNYNHDNDVASNIFIEGYVLQK